MVLILLQRNPNIKKFSSRSNNNTTKISCPWLSQQQPLRACPRLFLLIHNNSSNRIQNTNPPCAVAQRPRYNSISSIASIICTTGICNTTTATSHVPTFLLPLFLLLLNNAISAWVQWKTTTTTPTTTTILLPLLLLVLPSGLILPFVYIQPSGLSQWKSRLRESEGAVDATACPTARILRLEYVCFRLPNKGHPAVVERPCSSHAASLAKTESTKQADTLPLQRGHVQQLHLCETWNCVHQRLSPSPGVQEHKWMFCQPSSCVLSNANYSNDFFPMVFTLVTRSCTIETVI
jgi:hypothetical protein